MGVEITIGLIIDIINAATKLIIALEPVISEYIKKIQDKDELDKLDEVKLRLSDAGLTATLAKVEEQIAEREAELGL